MGLPAPAFCSGRHVLEALAEGIRRVPQRFEANGAPSQGVARGQRADGSIHASLENSGLHVRAARWRAPSYARRCVRTDASVALNWRASGDKLASTRSTKTLELSVILEEPPRQVQRGATVKEANRARCNKLTDGQREKLMDRALELIYGRKTADRRR